MASPGRISTRILLILGSVLAALAIGYSFRSGRPPHPVPGTPGDRESGVPETSTGTGPPESPGTEPSGNGTGTGTGPEKELEDTPSALPPPAAAAPAPAAVLESALPPAAPREADGTGVPGSATTPPARSGEKLTIRATEPPADSQPDRESQGEEGDAGGPSKTGTTPQGTSSFSSQGLGLSVQPGPPAPEEAPLGRRSSSFGGGAPPAGDSGAPPRTAHVRMVPDATEVRVGSRLSLRILISEAADVASVPFHLFYNPSVLKFEGGVEGDFLMGDGRQTAFFAAPTSSGNEVVVGLSRLGRGDGREGGGELCTLQFTVVGPGDAQLQWDRAKVRTSSNLLAPAVFEPVAILAQ